MTMTEARYDLYLSGELALGCDRETAVRQLASLFKRPPEQVAQLLAGKPTRVRKGLTEEALNRYQQGFDKLGVLTEARLCQQEAGSASHIAHHAAASSEPLSLTPVGTPVLREHERPRPTAVEVDVSALSLSGVGSQLSESKPITAQAPDTSHLSVAEVGADLGADRDTAQPDVDALAPAFTVAEPGTPLHDPQPAEPISAPDTRHLVLKDR